MAFGPFDSLIALKNQAVDDGFAVVAGHPAVVFDTVTMLGNIALIALRVGSGLTKEHGVVPARNKMSSLEFAPKLPRSTSHADIETFGVCPTGTDVDRKLFPYLILADLLF